jgi:N-acetylneuraminic acid mutarotase
LPVSLSRAAAVALGGRVVLVGGSSVLAGSADGPLRRVAALPSARSAAAAAVSGGSVWVVGGERAGRPTDEILRIEMRPNRVTAAGRFEEPLAEAGFAARGGSLYLVGGWTGEKYATAILRVLPPGQVALVARLPAGLRAPAVAIVGTRLYVAGGLGESGPTRSLLTVDLQTGVLRRIGELPQAVSGAMLVPAGSYLYLLDGTAAGGVATTAVVRIDPATGRSTVVGKTPISLPGATAVTVGKSILVFAGRSAYRLR